MNFHNRHIVITGGSSGIGKAIAREFLKRGNHVHLLARNLDLLQQTRSELNQDRKCKGTVSVHACDVSDSGDVEQTFREFAAAKYNISVLVNSAGVSRPGYFEALPREDFEGMMRINFFGTLNCVKAILPELKKQGDGYIVNVSSMAGLLGVFGMTAYSATKFAINGFSESLRQELKPKGIMVSVLCPPDTDTPMLEDENKCKPAETVLLSSAAKILSADEVATALVRGMEKNRFLIIPGMQSKLIHWIYRLSPRFVAWMIDQRIKAFPVRR